MRQLLQKTDNTFCKDGWSGAKPVLTVLYDVNEADIKKEHHDFKKAILKPHVDN